MRTAYKCRAYPDSEQTAIFSRTFGCVRLVWNKTLAERHRAYHEHGRSTSYKETDAVLTGWKKTQNLAFLSEVSSVPLQQALRHQHASFANFFAGRARYPRFKSRNARQSAHYTRSAFRMRDGELRIAKTASPLAFVWSFDDVDLAALNPTMVVISREPDGRWYVTFAVDTDEPDPLETAGHEIGIDLGIKDFAVTSDGERIANPRHLERKARNLARYQRRMVRCQRGSNNRRKARAKVARAHRKVGNARADKAERTGRTVVVVDRWYPSSKTCSACGHLLAELSLSTRHWTCPGCRIRHDRDINAAKNILAAGRVAAREQLGDVCGADVRRQGSSLPRSAVNQKPPTARAVGIPSL